MAYFGHPLFKEVDLHPRNNNFLHHTSEISVDQLIVRRGQPFKLTLNVTQPFDPKLHPLLFTAKTGSIPTEKQGTLSLFGVQDVVTRSPSAKGVWRADLLKDSSPHTVVLNLTPPAVTPVGEWILAVKLGGKEKLLGKLVVLYNPWCPDDWVYLKDEKEINEYVLNEQGVIYTGSNNYIHPVDWDFGQFEDNMVKICLRILDLNLKHGKDPADDVSARCNPIYVSRVVSAMINSVDDRGVVMGNWSSSYSGGTNPTKWSGSYPILQKWYNHGSKPVKYGQCWVFAGVMCSVMRLLGIPCRVVTNFQSAHDTNGNLTIDEYHADNGVVLKKSNDSIWNFHVWTEAWMRRPDLANNGTYDGWQVVDPTPQEESNGVYCCGPSPVKAIHNGETNQKYDTPFVFAEVNADCVDWLVKADKSQVKISTDTRRVGQYISTKSVGSRRRNDITDSYKHREGSKEERAVFNYAKTKDYSEVDDDEELGMNGVMNGVTEEDEEDDPTEDNAEVEEAEGTHSDEEEDEESEEEDENGTTGSPDAVTLPVIMHFEEVTPPRNGKDVKLRLVLGSESSSIRSLSVNISVQAMRYNGVATVNIQTEVKDKKLLPRRDLVIPIRIPFLAYHKAMVDCYSLKVSALVTDKQRPDSVYLAEDNVVLKQPAISLMVSRNVKVERKTRVKLIFLNPTDNETLTNCTLTFSGSGLMRNQVVFRMPDLKPKNRIRVMFSFVPYKSGKRTLVADFDCSTFRDIKASRIINVQP
ncbi:hypothetical protein PBY51_012658 [Eleginops maclovinus]|uniref:protein-glutamine gamma-glutamyltransferase n=1 Tax=Eleginops maclovinus TaxID=56733 RepID=A0AAN8ATQ7_ELEMC|nr:hypothetical protein PBY51_012658 [Eleginops maclovinus]